MKYFSCFVLISLKNVLYLFMDTNESIEMNLKDELLNHERNKFIRYDAKAHEYWFRKLPWENEEKYDGVTKWLKSFQPHFDKDKISKGIAKRDGVTQEQVLADWQGSTDYGVDIHAAVENFVVHGLILEGHEHIVEKFQELTEQMGGVEWFASEFTIYNEDIKRASPLDLVGIQNGKLIIADTKTWAKGIVYSGYKNQTMLDPISHLPNANFYQVSLQTSIYADWLEHKYGMPVDASYVICMNFKKDVYEWMPCLDLTSEIQTLYEFSK